MPIIFTKKSTDQHTNEIELDGAGIIYPYVTTKKWNSVFRIETEIDSEIDVSTLKQAVINMKKRFPSFFVKVAANGNSYKLYKSAVSDIVRCEGEKLCTPFEIEEFSHPLVRVTYKDNRIGLELFHSVADGHGATVFMKSLLREYFNLLGEDIPATHDILDCKNEPSAEETEDSFRRICKTLGGKNVNRVGAPVYQYGKNRVKIPMNVTEISIDEASLKAVSKNKNVTIGVLLTSAYVYSFIKTKEDPKHGNITISVPVDMRKFFPSETVRNFSQYILVSVKMNGKMPEFDEVVEEVSRQFKEKIDKEQFKDMIYTNVAQAESAVFKAAPLAIKRIALKFGFSFLGEMLFTSTVSNLGKVSLPKELEKHIKTFRFILGEPKINGQHGGVSSFGGVTRMMVSSRILSLEVQEQLCDILNSCGVSASLSMRNPQTGKYVSYSNHTERLVSFRQRPAVKAM